MSNTNKPDLKRIIYNATYEYGNGEDRCRDCGCYAFSGRHEDGCHYGKIAALVASLDIKEIENMGGLPQVMETPPMPKCKPPKLETELTCDSCIYKIDADGGSGISCNHTCRTGCSLDYKACSWYKTEDICKGIQHRLTANAEDFDGIIMDILKELATIQTCKEGHKFVANSHEYPCPWCIIEKTRNQLS